ncbi:uncharacterized protein LOC113381410 [Ctenocephalides felis]|uniref:uncharacterized protein LOC113381253 n=1 Tax=Ctenocephalides felis TaxID=7515 RepID=UPI000E6E46ED|nr:uncharacterized protein LOC113381253 [Ctenocephalides felis]XP_026476121.1 uncharacterized protein LOC113381410 [Ctenocephalides felis]
MSDVLQKPPTKDKYNTLKSIILDRVSESRSRQVDKLLTNMVLGDKKPGQLLREMIDLARNEISEDIIHKLWLDRLPQHIRTLLLVSNNIGLQAIGEMADRLIDTCGLPPSVIATANRAPEQRSDRTQDILIAMMQKLNALMTEVENLKHTKKHKERSRTRSHARHRRGRSKTPSKSQVWFYHSRFGEKATRCIEPCLVKTPKPRKLTSPSTPGASNGGDINSVCPEFQLSVADRKTRIHFLIDSVSVLSILPASKFATGRAKEELFLYAANSSRISTYGKRTLELDLSLRRPFTWQFTIVDVTTAIIGADLLSHYNLLIDLKGKRLIDSTTGLASDGKGLKTQNINISTINPQKPFRSLLNKYLTITTTLQRSTIKPYPFPHRIPTIVFGSS